ncbi:MAG: thermonuclease family protein [Methylomicrobium sp.]
MRPLLTKLLIFLLGLSAAGAVEIYRWRDERGQFHFSDKLREGAERLRLTTDRSYQTVRYVYDGDTVTLTSGKKIRLLGINTPEIEGRNKSAEPGGEEAKRWLTQALKDQRVNVVLDVEKQDKYGRTLAHLITENKRHINVEIVRAGLATANIHPPNLLYSRELVAAQDEAETAARGIWRLPDYQPKPASAIKAGSHRGWQRIVGRVQTVKTTRKFVYLTLTDHVDLRLERSNLALFPSPKSYVGKTLEARGWLNKSKTHFSMLIRHPSALKLL